MNQVYLSIQIINYNTKKYLENCLSSVIADLEDADFTYQILVLDNNSADSLSSLESKYTESQVKFYKSKTNLGFGAGHNWLAKKAKSKYILLLNPDIEIIEPKTISRLLASIQDSQKIKVVGPRLMTKEKLTQIWDHGEVKGLKAYIADQVNRSKWQEQIKPTKVAWVSGAVFLIDRTVFEKLDGFDKNFFLYAEEEELCYRLRRMGGAIIYDPKVNVLHYGGVSTSQDERRAHHERSKSYFSQKHAGKRMTYPIWHYLDKKINDRNE